MRLHVHSGNSLGLVRKWPSVMCDPINKRRQPVNTHTQKYIVTCTCIILDTIITQRLLTFILSSTACNLDSMRHREDSTVLEKVEKAFSRSLHLQGTESTGSIASSVCVCFSAVPIMMWNTFSSDLKGMSDVLESESESE